LHVFLGWPNPGMDMTTLNTAANEQMREKADAFYEACALVPDCPLYEPEEWNLQVDDFINALAKAFQEAHAAGRQEILDRLPSDEELLTWCRTELSADHADAENTRDWIASRLSGER